MTREEALNDWLPIIRQMVKGTEVYTEALDMAIEALEQEPCEDCISRQAVNDKMRECDEDLSCMAVRDVRTLPSVTPQPKMVERWIPVSERLPDTLKEVIIAFANEPDEYDIAYLRTTSNKTYIANGSKKEWVSSMGETTYAEYEVDAWMPIIPYQSEIPTVAEGSEKND